MDRIEGQRIGGKYALVRPLASGGMGAVWVARHDALGTEVAVKFIRAQWADDSTAVRRFRREARATAQLESPHVPRIYDYGLDDQTPYIAMELFRGASLHDVLDGEGRLTTRRVADIITQIARALTEAHAAGIVHRDLKPRNIFIAQVAGQEVVKVLDFGVAKLTGAVDNEHATLTDDATMTGALVGSPAYMSPEQARGGDVDFRSDVWSLATIAFEALTGRRAFVGRNVGDIIAAVTGDPLPVPSELCASLSADHDTFMQRALARNPDARFQSAAELARALTELATEDEVIASTEPAQREPSLGRTITTVVEPAGAATLEDVAVETALDAIVESPIRAPKSRWAFAVIAALGVGGGVLAVQLDDHPAPRMRSSSLRSSSVTTTAAAPMASPPVASVALASSSAAAPALSSSAASSSTASSSAASSSAASSSAASSSAVSTAPTVARRDAMPRSDAPPAEPASRPAPRTEPAPQPIQKPKVDPFFGVP